MQSIASELVTFYRSLRIGSDLPPGISLLNPQANEEVLQIIELFFTKFYSDSHPRQLLFGINPGRFGAGTTGINFTAPKQLREKLGIDHSFKDKTELSAEFIYEVIDRYGGAGKFYSDFFLTAISPLGFMQAGKNLNYYDDKSLLKIVEPFIIKSIGQQLRIFRPSQTCICIGGEKNYEFFVSLNNRYQFFKTIIPLPHPRFIMQYRRKQKNIFLLQYLSALEELRK